MDQLSNNIRRLINRQPSRKNPQPVEFVDGFDGPHYATSQGRSVIRVGKGWVIQKYLLD